jgi:hypothetical protein
MLALAAAVAAPSAFAVTDAQLKVVKKNLNAVPAPELPAKAAELVTQAQKEDREAVAETVVRAAIYKSRPSAPLVVAAVSKAAPEVAGAASRVAAEMEAGQSDNITAAAAGAAPAAKTQIASGVQQGVYGGTIPASTTTPKFTASSFGAPSTVPSTATTHTPAGLGALSTTPALSSASIPASASDSYTIRGGAKTVEHGGHVELHDTPINHEHGGLGNGRFPEHPPFVVPPGHDPDHREHHGRPSFVDYTKPRHF